MAYNLTLVNNITDAGTALSFINTNAAGLFFVLLIVALIIIIVMRAVRDNTPQIKAIFYAFMITLVPVVLLRGVVNWGAGLLPDWYVILHIMFLAISGLFTYLHKS